MPKNNDTTPPEEEAAPPSLRKGPAPALAKLDDDERARIASGMAASRATTARLVAESPLTRAIAIQEAAKARK